MDLNRMTKPDQTRRVDYRALAAQMVPQPLTHDDARQYSIARVVRQVLDRDFVDGLEGEVHAECKRIYGEAHLPPRGGVYVPMSFGTRDLTVATPSAGGYMAGAAGPVPTIAAGLRARSYVITAGAQVMPMAPASTSVPTAAGASASWQANETTTISPSAVTFTTAAVAPKLVSCNVVVSRRLLLNSPAIDAFLIAEIGRALAQAIDAAALNGSGSSGQPLGIVGTSGVATFTGTSLNTAGVVNAERDVIDAGGVFNPGALAFFTTGAVGETLKARLRTGNGSRYVADYEGGRYRIGPHPLYESANMPASTILYGDFSSCVICEWQTLSLLVNPYKSVAGNVEIGVWGACDIAVTHPESFSVATSVT